MVFSSAVFLIIFLPIVFIINCIIPKKLSNVWLLIASLLFYAWGEPVLVILMVASIIINWVCGKIISKASGMMRKIALILGIICDLGILGYYKYAGFMVDIINGIAGKEVFASLEIALPIGISFFTFQAISYIVDVYRKDTKASDKLINTALYISFFPQLIAGPIVKYKDINKQIEDRRVSVDKVSAGFKRFIYGLAKKVIIANALGFCVDSIYANDIDLIGGGLAWICSILYTFQIYYDFSGYSDMAIGLGKMFGFDILENFNYPYISRSITEFWRRWHISLGTWFREYVYIPLGGNRRGIARTYINLVIVFFLTGLWHGANYTFILWGMFHGLFMVIERLGFKRILDKNKIAASIYCFLVVNFGWVLFRAPDLASAGNMMGKMLCFWRYPDASISILEYVDSKLVFIMICAVLGMGVMNSITPQKVKDMWKGSTVEAIYCLALLVLSLGAIASDTYNPFIYFNF